MTNKILASALCTGTLLLTACGGGDSSNENHTTTSNIDYSKSETIDLITPPIVALSTIKYNPLYFINKLANDIDFYADEEINTGDGKATCESGTIKKNANGSFTINNCKNLKMNNITYGIVISGTIQSVENFNEKTQEFISNDLTLTNFTIKYDDNETEKYNGKVLQTYTFNETTKDLRVDYKISNMSFTWSDNTNQESYNLTDYLLTETYNVSTYTTTKAQAIGKLQANIDRQKFSVNFNSNREYSLYNPSPNTAVINIEDANNAKNAITIKNSTAGKVLISAFANGTSLSGYPKIVDWDYFE
ncbi:MAG: hypothetical protein I8H98_11240 [Moraxellaceae bacterium]|uniref:Lipoprotein n=1 Tax=Acinetobacter tjernbergiae DSM 14971 = CIP 107465 TaxID=1120928 RepID=V2W927_9GAMM|nr:hypothetical protein [Acinetobacter tjernbergiae]ESK56534.1 hypothetical protein F990_00867 [Acinetobacter tjernbergiae DSM 14971 = CIP 107465]MBH2002818.1 hypothetical protein [Moraxellaceae bacterium]MBH2029409.1 hypothetical protein [Moraxellaceae bacterium]